MEFALTDETRFTAAILLLAIVTIEYGGTYVLRVVRGTFPATEFQKSFHRAGHGHAGVLVILSLVVLLYADAASLTGATGWMARSLVPASALLIPGGFFFSSLGRDVTAPNRLIVLIWIGAVTLAAGLIAAGVGLLTAA